MGSFEVNKFQASLPVQRKACGEINTSIVTSARYCEVHDIGQRETVTWKVSYLSKNQSFGKSVMY